MCRGAGATLPAMPHFKWVAKKNEKTNKQNPSFLFLALTNARRLPSLFRKWKWKFHLGLR